MIALQYSRYGEPTEVVAAVDVPTPEPQAGEVRLRVIKSPIHNHDLATIRGVYGVKPPLPAIGGSELVGVVDALGPGVDSVRTGQRVSSMLAGAWGGYAIARASSLAPVPDALPDDAACQILAMPLSALVLFEDLRVKPGDWIVQNAANGAVARMLCGIAQRAGVNVVNLVRRPEAAQEIAAYGAQHIIVGTEEGWRERLLETLAGAPLARVVDSVCDAQSTVLNRMLGPRGEHVIFGALAGTALKLDPGALIFGETVTRGFWMTTWIRDASPQDRANATMRVFGMALAGELPLPVGGVYPLEEAAAALKAAETPGRPGKVLFAP